MLHMWDKIPVSTGSGEGHHPTASDFIMSVDSNPGLGRKGEEAEKAQPPNSSCMVNKQSCQNDTWLNDTRQLWDGAAKSDKGPPQQMLPDSSLQSKDMSEELGEWGNMLG
eukprot:961594-Amphidinium_carterae.1